MGRIPLPIIAWFVAKGLTSLWGARVKLVRCFQERLSELGMGRFIMSYDWHDHPKEIMETYIETVIRAYLCIISVPSLLAVYPDEIMNTPWLDRFFIKYEDYQKWKVVKQALGERRITNMPREVTFKQIIEMYDMPELIPKIPEMLSYPAELMKTIIGAVWTTITEGNMSVDKIVDHVNQNLQTYRFPPWVGLIPAGLWRIVHPTIDLDWAVIKSYITLLKSYQKIRGILEYEGLVDPWIKGQVARILIDGKVYDYEYVDEHGIVKFRIPYGYQPLRIDTFGMGIDFQVSEVLEPVIRIRIRYNAGGFYIDHPNHWMIVSRPWGDPIRGWKVDSGYSEDHDDFRDMYTWNERVGNRLHWKCWWGKYKEAWEVWIYGECRLWAIGPEPTEGRLMVDSWIDIPPEYQ